MINSNEKSSNNLFIWKDNTKIIMIKAIIQKKRYLFFLKGRISNFSDESIFLTSPINFNLFSIRRIFIFMTAYKDKKKNIATML